jgi:hypothetical protein
LIGGIMGLCVVAGVGGYAISQMSKADTRNEPHVLAPLPTTQPPGVPAAPAAATPEPAAAATPAPAAVAPPASAPAATAAPSDAPAGKPTTPTPTVVEPPSAKPVAAPAPAENIRPAETSEPRARDAIDANPAVKKPLPEPKHTATRPAGEPRPATEPRPPSKPAKPKKADDLFDSRH